MNELKKLIEEQTETIAMMQETINNLMTGLVACNQRINGVLNDVETIISDKSLWNLAPAIRELQEEVAKLANTPKGMLFYRTV
jgi:polyhydroxyalkanoate synthesis regulator phasin